MRPDWRRVHRWDQGRWPAAGWGSGRGRGSRRAGARSSTSQRVRAARPLAGRVPIRALRRLPRAASESVSSGRTSPGALWSAPGALSIRRHIDGASYRENGAHGHERKQCPVRGWGGKLGEGKGRHLNFLLGGDRQGLIEGELDRARVGVVERDELLVGHGGGLRDALPVTRKRLVLNPDGRVGAQLAVKRVPNRHRLHLRLHNMHTHTHNQSLHNRYCTQHPFAYFSSRCIQLCSVLGTGGTWRKRSSKVIGVPLKHRKNFK